MALQAVGAPGANACHAVTREQTLEAICRTPLLYEPGTRTVYSDVDYMLLTFVVEKITGRRLDAYMKDVFYAPLGLDHITFLPLENGFSADDCAATELNGNTRDHHISFDGIRTETLQGEVHDERAWYCMEGVSGHAGLFANATDLAKLASMIRTYMLNGGKHIQFNVVDKETLLDAQIHKEQHRDLIVRVAGYSAYFTMLTPGVQQDVISRTGHEL